MVNILRFPTVILSLQVNSQSRSLIHKRFFERTNSEDPDQTAPIGAV